MRIKELYNSKRPVVSFEVFPPKKDDEIEVIYESLGIMASLSPDFISVTFGAGGTGNGNRTSEISSSIQNNHGISAMAHMTCIGAEKDEIRQMLDEMKEGGVHNILALRGDLPEGRQNTGSYRYASELIRDIRSHGDFCIGAACYPEGHIECDNLIKDTEHLLRKQEAGADFLITQLFFDNEYFYRFLDRARAGGITIPISAGVMPILGKQQIERMIFLCGASLPSDIIKLLHKYRNNPSDLRKAGIEYSAKQVEDLIAHGVDGVHIYTMNKPAIAGACMERIGRA